MVDMWLELFGKANPLAVQYNEVIVPLSANTAEGVEALFVVNTPGSYFGGPQFEIAVAENSAGHPLSKKKLTALAESKPANVTDYYNYAAKELASTYYGGVPGGQNETLSPSTNERLTQLLMHPLIRNSTNSHSLCSHTHTHIHFLFSSLSQSGLLDANQG